MSLKKDFNQYFDYLVKEGKLSSSSIKDLCFKCYCQGTTRSSAKDIPMEEVEKWVENKKNMKEYIVEPYTETGKYTSYHIEAASIKQRL